MHLSIKTLYVNNYRGFRKSFIPLETVNFLVGENSTGKTSILKLLKLVSSESFWRTLDFNCEDVELGYFHEIINQFSENKKTFSIGMEQTPLQKGESNNFILIEFAQKNNIPRVTRVFTVVDNETVLIKYNIQTAYYKIIEKCCESFENWVTSAVNLPRCSDYDGKINLYSSIFGTRSHLRFSLDDVAIKIRSDKNKRVKTFDLWYTNDITWLAPIRAKPQRIYDSFKHSFSAEGHHAPVLLKNILSDKNKNGDIIRAIEKFGKNSSLFEKIEIKNLDRYEGAPFEINILHNKVPIRITNVGYGLSQVIPLLIQLLITRASIFSIQQPEVHLHPKAQAAFGELLFENVYTNNNRFVIETHSDYTINRFRYCMHNRNNEANFKAQILFFERDEHGTKITPLPLSQSGQYPDEIPDSYGAFFIDEELKMLEF